MVPAAIKKLAISAQFFLNLRLAEPTAPGNPL
jgi:hypothetical protein